MDDFVPNIVDKLFGIAEEPLERARERIVARGWSFMTLRAFARFSIHLVDGARSIFHHPRLAIGLSRACGRIRPTARGSREHASLVVHRGLLAVCLRVHPVVGVVLAGIS